MMRPPLKAAGTFVRACAMLSILFALALSLSPARAQAPDPVLSRDAVLRDAEIPAVGNPDGDITIVEFFDFQCPFCRKVHPELRKVMKEDSKVRVVYKDWPVFGGVSIDAAKIVLAAKYQGKFAQAHDALITSKTRLTQSNLAQLLTKAGVDAERAANDLKANAAAIDAILARNNAQAEAFGFNSTPSFIIGTFRVPLVLDAKGFKLAIADARKMHSNAKP
jgi:protein-disulfide isomerase